MALKDWEKDPGKHKSWITNSTQQKREGATYFKKIGYGKVVDINPVTKGNREVWKDDQKIANWRVQIGYFSSGGGNYDTKKFKTKSQALKYAKAYMRKN